MYKRQYLGRLSGPLLDRIDLYVDVPPLEYEELSRRGQAESSAAIRRRVNAARAIQTARFGPDGPDCNAHMGPPELLACCALDLSLIHIFGAPVTTADGLRAQSYRFVSGVLPFNQGLAPGWQGTADASQNWACLLYTSDYEFLDALDEARTALEQAKAWDTSAFSDPEKAALEQAVAEAETLIGGLDETYMGLWLEYVAEKGSALYGPCLLYTSSSPPSGISS